MVIALDYDNTYTEDPELWDTWIEHAKSRGHVVVCVTYRRAHDTVEHPMRGIEVFYTGGIDKAPFMRDSGLSVDVWIDDWPELIGRTRPEWLDAKA